MRASLPATLIVAALIVVGCGDEDEPTASGTTTTTTSEAGESAPAADGGGQPGGDEPAEQPQGGGGDAEEPEERPLSVEDVTEAVLTGSAQPVVICDELVTERFVRSAYGSRQGCLAAVAPGAGAKSAEVGDVSESGSRASAVAVPSGGPYDGIDVAVSLVADPDLDGAWVLDELVADIPAGP